MNLESKDAKIGLIIIFVGLIFVLNNFGVFEFGDFIWKLWPILLIWLGYRMLRRRGTRTTSDGNFQVFGDTVTETTSPYIRHSSAFGDIRIKINATEFAGGNASTVFGKVSIDLGSIESVTGYGQLDLHSVFGDITIRLPRNVAVELSSCSSFGSIVGPDGNKLGERQYSTPGFEDTDHRLKIRVSQVFGDIELIQ